MSEITPEKVAAAAAWGVQGWRENLRAALSMSAKGNVLSLTTSRWGHDPEDIEGREHVRHFRAVVVEGEQVPIVLEWPAELGMEWHDGGDMLALTKDGITLFPGGAAEWVILPELAREMAAHLAAMADAREAAQAGQTRGAE